MRVSVLVDSVYVQGVLICNDINSMSHPVNQAMLAMPKKPLACPLKFFVTTGIKLEIIGGHGFWDKGGSTPGGDLKKIFRPPSAAENFFVGAATGG